MRSLALALFLLYATSDEWSEFTKLAKDRDPDRRCEAIEKIRPRADLPMVQALLPLLADPHPRVRKRAAEAVARATSPACVEFLSKTGLRHPHRYVRIHAAGCLGTIGDKGAAPALMSALSDPDPDVRAAACSSLAFLEFRDAVPKIAGLAERDPAWLAKASALEAVASLDRESGERLAQAAVADRAYQVRLSAARVGGLRTYAIAIADSDWRVRVQAIESACVLRDRAVIGPIVELLGKEQGRLRWDAWLALRNLTGKELGLEPAHWKRWWDMNKETFEVPPAGSPAAERPGGETGVSFFSIPILSTRMSFVFDLSGSMRDSAPKGNETKLDVAKREAGKTFAQLPEAAWFNVLLLGCDVEGRYPKDQKKWKKSLHPATPAGRSDAASYLNRQEGRGWTNIWDGIELAFEDDLVDTIYLYTDGGASRGTFVMTADILDELQEMNRFRKIMIHTVEVAAEKPNTADNIRLLKGLAESTKGLYRLAK
ncbi:MAG TPA: HEAT repeat domain-containing protein [Planctomycetota bacterium]|nr:HEAT repeat domain-containing protein [Planctomycetota bacterium]